MLNVLVCYLLQQSRCCRIMREWSRRNLIRFFFANILREHTDFRTNNFVEIFDLLVTTMASCHFSARRHRLDCLYYLIIHISMTAEEKKNKGVEHFLTEIPLAVKEANRKIKERKEKKKSSSSQHGEDETKSLHSRASTTRRSKWNHTDVFSEFGDEENDDSCEDMDSRTTEFGVKRSIQKSKSSMLRSRNIRKSNKRLPEDCMDILGNEPLDLLDKQKTRAMLKVGKQMDQRFDSDDEPVLAPDGRLVISEEELGHSRKRRAKDDKPGEDTDGGSEHSRQSKSQTTSASLSKRHEKRHKTSASGWAYTGNEYKSKKASGDIKKEGKLEPYAYWPLDRKMLNRREEKRAIAKKGLSSVVTLTKQLQGKSVKHALSTTRKQKSHKGKSYRKSK